MVMVIAPIKKQEKPEKEAKQEPPAEAAVQG